MPAAEEPTPLVNASIRHSPPILKLWLPRTSIALRTAVGLFKITGLKVETPIGSNTPPPVVERRPVIRGMPEVWLGLIPGVRQPLGSPELGRPPFKPSCVSASKLKTPATLMSQFTCRRKPAPA